MTGVQTCVFRSPELVETARTAGAGGVKVLSEIFTPTNTDSDDEEDEL